MTFFSILPDPLFPCILIVEDYLSTGHETHDNSFF